MVSAILQDAGTLAVVHDVYDVKGVCPLLGLTEETALSGFGPVQGFFSGLSQVLIKKMGHSGRCASAAGV